MNIIPFLLVIFSGGAAASQSLPPAIKKFEDQGIKIIKKVTVPGGQESWLGEYQNVGVTLFLTPDGRHAVSGYLYDEEGHNLSEAIFRKEIYIPEGKKIWQKLLNAQPLTEGRADASHRVVVFADPFCPYCKQFRRAAQPWVAAGKVRLDTLLVAFLNPRSGRVATAILNADEPVSAWREYELSNGKKIPHFDKATPRNTYNLLQYHQRLMNELGAQATPAIYYVNDQGELQQVIGMPDENQLQEIMGPLN